MLIEHDVPLAPRTTLGVGGAAAFYARAEDETAVVEALRWAKQHGVQTHILGGGSNVVVSDGGIDGLVLEIALSGFDVQRDRDAVLLTVGAGESWESVVKRAVRADWAGIECLSGIPGRVGATPIQNVGAYGQDVAETIARVRCYDRKAEQVVEIEGSDCGFGYRDSRFKSVESDRWVVLSVTYQLRPGGAPALRYPELTRHLEQVASTSHTTPGGDAPTGTDAPTLTDVRNAVLALRRAKSMVLDPADPNRRSCGSFFVNPVVDAEQLAAVTVRVNDASMPQWPERDGRTKLSAAWLIERAGFPKGHRSGPVGLSTKHTLCVVAHDGARADDVIAFARRIRARVAERFAVRLVPEPDCWGFASLDDRLPDDRVT